MSHYTTLYKYGKRVRIILPAVCFHFYLILVFYIPSGIEGRKETTHMLGIEN